MSQLVAEVSAIAFERCGIGKISELTIHAMGPRLYANEQTKTHERARMEDARAGVASVLAGLSLQIAFALKLKVSGISRGASVRDPNRRVDRARADADSDSRPVDVGHGVQAAVGKHHEGCLDLCIRRRERNGLGTLWLGANQADVPFVASRGVAEQSRVGVRHELQGHPDAPCQRRRHVGRHANGLAVRPTRRDQQEVGQVNASP